MKLIIDDAVELDSSVEEEINESSGATERNYYLSGILTTPDKKNRNGRIYPRSLWEREIAKYKKEIEGKTVNSLSEWEHPPRAKVDPMKAVARIVEVDFKDDGNVWCKVKILNDNTDMTNKIKGLIKEGVKIGISTRGVGKVSATGMVTEFKLVTADLVANPSNYGSELNGIVENHQFDNGIMLDKEYTIDEQGCIGEECDINKKALEALSEGDTEDCPITKKIQETVQKVFEDFKETIKIEQKQALQEEQAQELAKALKSMASRMQSNPCDNIKDPELKKACQEKHKSVNKKDTDEKEEQE